MTKIIEIKNNFIEKSKKVHDNFYDYSLVEYKNNTTKVKIICPEHGIFEQSPKHHANGSKCPSCRGLKKLNNKTFIDKSREVHGNFYDYSLVEYKNNKTKVKIICSNHGIFEQKPNDHLMNHGCPKCYGNEKSQEEFISECKIKQDNFYDYSLVEYKNNTIICPEHGIFEQIPKNHLRGSICPKCSSKNSKPEKQIINLLESKKIKYHYQYRFKNCKNKRSLPFDFYLPDYNLIIEYDGQQHFKPIEIFGGEKDFTQRKINDIIKNNYCLANNIKLLRVSYKEDFLELISNMI